MEIINIFISIIMQFVFLYCYKKTINVKTKIKKSKIFLGIISILIYGCLWNLMRIYLRPLQVSLLSLIFLLCLCYFLFKDSAKETIVKTILLWIIFFLLDFILIVIMSIFFHFISVDTNIFFIIGSILIYCTAITLFQIKRLLNLFLKIANGIMRINYSYIKIILIVFIIVLLSTICYTNLDYLEFATFITIFMISFLFLIGIIIKQEYNIFTLKKQNQYLINNNGKFLKNINNDRAFKHNLTNKLLGVKSVVDQKGKDLINDIIQEYNSGYDPIIHISEIPDGINGIVYEKLSILHDKQVNVEVDNCLDFELLDIISARSYNLLVECLGVCLDNAIEAVINAKEKVLMICINEEEENIVLEIINTFSHSIDVDKLGMIDYTTKSRKGHGLGLFSLFEKKNVTVQTHIINNTFRNMIYIKKTNKNQK